MKEPVELRTKNGVLFDRIFIEESKICRDLNQGDSE